MKNATGRIVNRFLGGFQHRIGIANTRRFAKACNRVRYRSEIAEVVDGYHNLRRTLQGARS